MLSVFLKKYGLAFFDILFLRLRPDNTKQLSIVGKILVYAFALLLFYLPIFYFSAKNCIESPYLIAYFVIIAIIHVLAKIMLSGSKKVQKRFSTIKQERHFLMRTWLIVEYVFFMWLVYLFYPLTCILFPLSLLSMSWESLLGHDVIFKFFLQNAENFIFFGGIVSYVLFIIADGYKKLKNGFLPDYLGLYAVLTVVSLSFEGISQKFIEYFSIDISALVVTLSWVFSLSNNSMNIVASAVTLFFAVHSLYKNCGTGAIEERGDASLELQDMPANESSQQ